VLFTVFLIYPGVSANVLALFVCDTVYGTSYLLADVTVHCYDTRWWSYFPLMLVMIGLYPVGVPALVFYTLRKNKNKLHDPGTKIQLGFLYEAYNLDTWFWEVVDMAHKLTMTSLISFMPIDAQMPIGMFVVVIYLWSLLLKQPYLRKDDDLMHQFVQVELYLVVLAGYILTSLGTVTLDYTTDVVLSGVMIAMTIGLLLAFLLLAFFNIRRMIRARRRRMMHMKSRSLLSSSNSFRQDKQIRLTVQRRMFGVRKARSKQAIVEERVKEMTTFSKQWI